VYLAALDIKKAFDSVNHNKLFNCLLLRGVPICIINVLRDWYSKLFVRVKWGTALSDVAMVSCGVRQGGVISPVLFNVFINVFINRLRSLQIGCHVNGLFLGCLFLCGRCYVAVSISYWSTVHVRCLCCYCRYAVFEV